MNVGHLDSVSLECHQHGRGFWPVASELLALIHNPLRHDLGRKLGSCVIEICTRKIQKEGASDDCHLQGKKRSIGRAQLRNVVPGDFNHSMFCQPLICREFALKSLPQVETLSARLVLVAQTMPPFPKPNLPWSAKPLRLAKLWER